MNESLDAKVKAINDAHQYAMELYDKLFPIFSRQLGNKIIKADGSLLAKVEKLLPELPFSKTLEVYYVKRYHLVQWGIKTSEAVKGNYWETVDYSTNCTVGELKGNVLTKIRIRPQLRSDYTTAEVLANRKAYEESVEATEKAKDKLWPFGEYDH